MAYSPQFDFDIYISSAPLDNKPSSSESRGWVDQFYEALGTELSRRIGRHNAVTTWRNTHEYSCFDENIRNAVEGSALFVALISPAYLQSDFCKAELETFYEKAAASRQWLGIHERSRFFPVLIYHLPLEEWPRQIADLGIRGFTFHGDPQNSPRGISRPSDPQHESFHEQLRTLAQEILRTLKSFENPPAEEPAPQSVQSARSIFISYRRGESTPYAARLYDKLSARFGDDRVFMDLDTIEPGDDFIDVITSYVSSCSILVALINKAWLEVKDDEGRPRIHNPEDFVSLEISVALNRGIRVIPVLVQGASMPRSQDLPESLAKLSRRNALELSDSRWSYDVNRLIQVLEKDLGRN
ncbi:MAG TPA: toll/interleukin-1 receptor domain-containing protein [Pyrinomonadaceae bacterium]|nr:toll/interleukin-1 receptor domain-containing protein [Pyrinomonadaceae bacterium]